VGETEHQSCLLFTSREKPTDLAALEGNQSFVRVLRLARLESKPCEQLLAEKGVAGTDTERARLIDTYAGNPLALKIVAQTIVELFGGEIAPFLEQGEVVFGGVRQLLDEQFERLSALEQTVFYWLAILREPMRLEELGAPFNTPVAAAHLLEGLEGLSRRSLVACGHFSGSFTLQSVVLEYATARLIAEASSEIAQGTLAHLIAYTLCQGQAKEYVRQTQEQLLVAPQRVAAGMARSNSGMLPVAPCAGQAGTPATCISWRSPPMAGCWPLLGLMPPSGSGTCRTARSC
jgi:hypothetical protein